MLNTINKYRELKNSTKFSRFENLSVELGTKIFGSVEKVYKTKYVHR